MADVFVDTDERLDSLVGTDFKLVQKIDGTAFAIDTLLLANFAALSGQVVRVADLGSGSGVLSFFLKFRKPSTEVIGFEVIDELHSLAQRNCQLNPQVKGLSFECLDIREIPSRCLPESFDLVVTNPPYYPRGSGKIPPNPARAAARHEMTGTLRDFIEAGAYLLPYGAKLDMILPANRVYEALAIFKELQLGLRRLRFIHPKEGQPAHLGLMEAERFYNGVHEPIAPLTIHLANGRLADEVDEIVRIGLKKVKS